jgi:hypothetical protein
LRDSSGVDFSEPNNYAFLDSGNITEICGVANFSQASGGTSRWSDVACTLKAPAMCRLQGGAAAAQAFDLDVQLPWDTFWHQPNPRPRLNAFRPLLQFPGPAPR